MTCPKCAAPLGVRLVPDCCGFFRCLACDRELDGALLVQAGVPMVLIDRIKTAARRASEVTSPGGGATYGEGLDDSNYVRAWREVRDETASILAEVRTHLPARADVVDDVFDTRPEVAWSDEAIIDWRRKQRRICLVQDYGYLARLLYSGEGDAPVPDKGTLPIPYPPELQSEEERGAFRLSFRLAATLFGPFIGPDLTLIPELEALRKKLGFRR